MREADRGWQKQSLEITDTKPSRNYEAVLPAGIVSLLVSKIVGEVMDASHDIGATYYAYLSKLVWESISTNSPRRLS